MFKGYCLLIKIAPYVVLYCQLSKKSVSKQLPDNMQSAAWHFISGLIQNLEWNISLIQDTQIS